MARSLYEHREAIVAALRTAMPPRVEVDSHHGRFDLRELERYSVKAPCVRVALLGLEDDDATQPQGACSLAAYIITKDGRAMQRDRMNLELGDLLIRLCKTDLLVVCNEMLAPFVSYANQYSSPAAEAGVTLAA